MFGNAGLGERIGRKNDFAQSHYLTQHIQWAVLADCWHLKTTVNKFLARRLNAVLVKFLIQRSVIERGTCELFVQIHARANDCLRVLDCLARLRKLRRLRSCLMHLLEVLRRKQKLPSAQKFALHAKRVARAATFDLTSSLFFLLMSLFFLLMSLFFLFLFHGLGLGRKLWLKFPRLQDRHSGNLLSHETLLIGRGVFERLDRGGGQRIKLLHTHSFKIFLRDSLWRGFRSRRNRSFCWRGSGRRLRSYRRGLNRGLQRFHLCFCSIGQCSHFHAKRINFLSQRCNLRAALIRFVLQSSKKTINNFLVRPPGLCLCLCLCFHGR